MTYTTDPLLACPACKSPLSLQGGGVCGACGTTYPVINGIISFVGGAVTALDNIDYDAVYNVDAASSHHLVSNCLEILGDRLPDQVNSFLEIGAGTGLFTLGFLSQVPVTSALITDISPSMLANCRKRLEHHGIDTRVRLGFAAWDGGSNCFRADKFDMAAGFSVLHHVLDYPGMITVLQRSLTVDGIALFFEPNYRFHCVMMDVVSEILCSIAADDPDWTSQDRNSLTNWLFENNINLRFRADGEMLAGREDKHVFDGGELRVAALAGGFASVELVPAGGRDECLSALRVYSSQIGLSDPARDDLMIRFTRQLPGAFAHLSEEDRAPSFLVVFRNSDRNTQYRSIGSFPDYSPVVANPGLLYDLSIQATKVIAGIAIRLTGWILGDADLKYLSLRNAVQKLKFPVCEPRPDVNKAFNASRTYPVRRALFSGVGGKAQIIANWHSASEYEVHAVMACGSEIALGTILLSETSERAHLTTVG